MEFQCRVIVQRRCTSCCSSVENIPLQAERHSARRQKLFAFPPESAFTFRPEFCSESQRNRVRLRPDSPANAKSSSGSLTTATRTDKSPNRIDKVFSTAPYKPHMIA